MGRIILTILIFIGTISISASQCPDLPNNTTVNGSGNTDIDMCGPMSALFEVDDPLLPSGSIDWYSSTISGFDPLSSGTLIGSSSIDSADPCDPGGCPAIEVIYIDACGPGDEGLNEFLVISSGSGFAVNDLSLNFDVLNDFGSAGNGNINVGGVCGWFLGNTALFSGCNTLISVGPGDYIPPNSAVIIQSSRFGSAVYDVSGLCGVSECIYVLSNSCSRTSGAFSNCGAGTQISNLRTTQINLTCGCNDALTYDLLDPALLDICTNIGTNGTHVFSDITFANNGCNNGPNLSSIPQFAYSAITDPFNHTFTNNTCNTTQYVVGVLNSTQYNTDCCTEQITEEFTFDIACITAELQGIANLCPGECAEITVLISGGAPPYNLDLTITGLPFPFNNINIPFIGFPLEQKITICFDNGGPLIDGDNFILDAPAIVAGFSGALLLNSITDDNGCAGTIQGSSISLSFNDTPDIIDPGDQEACDLGDGTGFFLLSALTNIINGGTGATVNYYSDPDGTMPISDPYTSSGGTIYAQVLGDPCDSEIIDIELVVLSNGDAGIVTFFCTDSDTGPSTSCTICDDDGVPGEDVSLTIIFENGSLNYEYEILATTESGSSSTISGSGIGTATVIYTLVETTTFIITLVTAEGDCADMTDLGDVITMNYSQQPDLDVPPNLSNCGSITLPEITGGLVPSNAAYYSQSGAMGTIYLPGDVIMTSGTYYLYAGIEGCDIEYPFEVVIEDEAVIDDPADVVTCGAYALPEITGSNVDNVSYFTEVDGGGNIVSEGTIISTSVILYLYDPICGGNQPTLNITITPGPVIDNNTDTIVCEMYVVEPITGMDLTGNEMYFDTTNGNGLIINVGDTLTKDSIIFIYDNTAGCEVQIPIFIDIQEPGYPGLDTAIILCQGDPTLVNINEALGGELPDTTGIWLDINNTGIVTDSTQVDFSSLAIGTYLFEYQISDSICVDTHSMLTVTIIGNPYAGEDATLTLCSDTSGVDVFNLLGSPDIGGTFYDGDNMVAGFDPSNASFASDPAGILEYSYVVGNPLSSCGADTSFFTVVSQGNVYAGDDSAVSICSGVVVDLTTLLSNHSGIGIFLEPSISGGLMGNTFDTEDVMDGIYTINHILAGIGACPADTATLTLTVSDGAIAGDDNAISLCGDPSVSLADFINGDAGGQFYYNGTMLPSGDIDYTTETGLFEYLYIVGDGAECPFDTAVLTVNRSLKPASFLDISLVNLCNNDCTTISFNAANTGGQLIQLYYHIESNMGEVENRIQDIGDLMPDVEITFCIGIGDLSIDELQPGTEYIFSLDSISIDNAECIFEDTLSVEFNTLVSVESTLTGTYCTNDEVTVGSDIYDINMPSGTTIIPNGSASGCDSIILVDLTFQDFAEGVYIENLCEGESITVNGTVYTETNTTDEFVIPNGSINGCDSLVRINIFFFEVTTSDFEETICAGDTIVVNGEDFFEGKESGTQTLENAMGCDSILQVTISIDDPVTTLFTGDNCASYSININGTAYNQANPSGIEEFINQASNGCDSVVIVDLTFNQEALDSTLTISTCDESYALQIGDMTFDANNTSGSVTIPANDPTACDTKIEVNLIFGELGVEYLEIGGGCTASEFGTVLLESSNGVFPLDVLYNGNNLKTNILPIEINLPIGSGEISVTDDNGCSTIIMYELFPGGEENFDIEAQQGQILVTGNQIDSIAWMPTEGLSCTDCLDPIAQPAVSTTYYATVFYGDSCSVELSVDIIVIDDTPDYILPSVFSPNGDNINDHFILTLTEGVTGIPQNMSIYDRWGNRIFTGFGDDLVTVGWDGTMNGNEVIPGVYVYRITIQENEKMVTLYGDITVVR